MQSIATQGHIASAMTLIGEAGEDIAAYLLSGIQCAMLVGEKLKEAKKLVSHGEWLTCLHEDGRFSERMAQKFMRAADLREEIEAEIRRGNSYLTLDQMLALFAKKSRKVTHDKLKEVNHNNGCTNGESIKSTPAALSPAPCTASGGAVDDASESSTVEFGGMLAPTDVGEVETVPSIDYRTVADGLDEDGYVDAELESGEIVIDAECVPSTCDRTEEILSDKFAREFRRGGQEDSYLTLAVERLVTQLHTAIADEATSISTKSGFIHYQWSPEMLASVIASQVAAALAMQ